MLTQMMAWHRTFITNTGKTSVHFFQVSWETELQSVRLEMSQYDRHTWKMALKINFTLGRCGHLERSN